MTDSADERSKVDRTKDPEDPTKDVREEYTSYRERESERPERDPEAVREADLQPGSAEDERTVETTEEDAERPEGEETGEGEKSDRGGR